MVNAFSVGKPVIALRLLQLVERGRINLDDRADRWWPELLAGRQGATVRDVLCHRAGVPAIREPLTNDALWDWRAMCTPSPRRIHGGTRELGMPITRIPWTSGW